MESNESSTPVPGPGENQDLDPHQLRAQVTGVLEEMDQLDASDIDGKSALLHQAHDLLTDALARVDRVR